MKLRQAAALALVGWYLLVPPIGTDRDGKIVLNVDTSAPLKESTIRLSFDTASQCQSSLDGWKAADQATDQSSPKPLSAQLLFDADQSLNSACVATDDPRLAK